MTCSATGEWQYEGTSVTEVSCELIPPPCGTCGDDDINLVVGDMMTSLTPSLEDIVVDGNGCNMATAVCDASDIENGKTIMFVSDCD